MNDLIDNNLIEEIDDIGGTLGTLEWEALRPACSSQGDYWSRFTQKATRSRRQSRPGSVRLKS